MGKTKSFSSKLKHAFKILGVIVAVIFFLFGIITWIVFEKKNDWFLKQIQAYMNESQSGQLEIASLDLKLFRNFPNVTIELDGINYYEHHDSLRIPNEKPILHADQFFVAVELMPLFHDQLKVNVISLSKAQLNVVEYPDGKLNINLALASPAKPKMPAKKIVTAPSQKPPTKIAKPKPAPSAQPKGALQIDLNRITLNDMLVSWNAFDLPHPYLFLIKNVDADFLREGKIINAQVNSSCLLQSVYVKDTQLPSDNIMLKADLRFEPEKQNLSIRELKIKYDALDVTILGTFFKKENNKLDLQVKASSDDLKLFSYFIKPELVKKNPELFKDGNFNVNGKVFGELSKQPLQVDVSFNMENPDFMSFIINADAIKKHPELLKKGDSYIKGRVYGELNQQLPSFDISFGLKNFALSMPDNLGAFRGIGFEGKFSSGKSTDFSEAALEIKNLRGQLPGGFIKGYFSVKNFVNPFVSYKLDAKLKLDGYDQIFQMDNLRNLSGSIALQAEFNGMLKLLTTHRMDNKRSSIIALENLSFVVAKTNQQVSGLTATIETRNNETKIQPLVLTYGKNDLRINASIDNLFYILFLKQKDIKVSGNIQSKQIYTEAFIFDTLKKADVQDRISSLSFDFKVATVESKAGDSTSMRAIAFDIGNLSARFDKLPDIKQLSARGSFCNKAEGFKLYLDEFHASLPHGRVDVAGDMLIPEARLLQLNAHVKLNRFPWTYVRELIAEMNLNKEPSSKNLPLSKMEIITADLNLSSELITYPFDINKLNVRNSSASISFPDSESYSSEKVNIAFDKLYFLHPENSGSLAGVKSANGVISLQQLNIPGLNAFDITMNMTGEDDKLNIALSRMTQKSKSEIGSLFIDNSKKEPEYRLHYETRGADVAFIVRKIYDRKFMEGKIDYVLDFNASGSTWTKVKQNLSGIIEVTADSIQLYGVDIDDVLKKYMESQNFNLTDLGAVIVAGPIGLAITKGSDFVSLAKINFDTTSQSKIHTLLSRWRIENRRLITEDVAVTTAKNRIAFNGMIDFAIDSIPGLTVAVVDKNGCSLMDQELYGKLNALQTGKLNVAKTLFGSVINSVDAVVGKDCVPVYTGRVKNPSK